jgi:hypothetical protein
MDSDDDWHSEEDIQSRGRSDDDDDEEVELGEDELQQYVQLAASFAPDLKKQNWKYSAFSERGKSFAGDGATWRNVRQDFKFEYNPSDDELFKQTKEGMTQAIEVSLRKLSKPDGADLSAIEALVAAFPPEVFFFFTEWLKANPTATEKEKNELETTTLQDMCAFLTCDIKMRILKCSKAILHEKVLPEDFRRFEKIKNLMSKADKPASKRNDHNRTDPYKLDPIMKKAFNELNQEWKKMGFVAKVTWVDPLRHEDDANKR